jgi:hypothetical protein
VLAARLIRSGGMDCRHYPGDVPELSGPASIPAEPIPSTPAGDPPRPRTKGPAPWAFAPRASVPVRIGMALFAIGVLAIVVIMVMFASGSHDLPLWLNLTAMLAPLGFAVGLAGVAVDARRSARALARATADQASDPGSQP